MNTKRSINWASKLQKSRHPKRVKLETDFAGIKAGNLLFVGTPQIVDAYLRSIPSGEARTVERMRRELARRHRCDAMCPVSTSIFLRMVAEGAWEEIQAGQTPDAVAPFWRVIEPGTPIAKRLQADSAWLRQRREAECVSGT